MPKILLIEDEESIISLLKILFTEFGYDYEVFHPSSLNEVLEHVKRGVDVILCDYMMPNITGWDVYNALEDEDRKKLIIMTGGHLDEDVEEEFKKKNVKVIYKPFNLTTMLDVIREKLKS